MVLQKGTAVTGNPFATLGLPAGEGLTDDDVRAAWRRIAAATHPDREDGGDPARYGAAAAAYMTLRTSFGRGEALADLVPARSALGWPSYRGRRRARRAGAHRANGARPAGAGWSTGYPGHPALGRALGVPVAAAAAVAAATVAAVGVTPATIGLLAGALTVTGWALWRRGGPGL
jgi:hypothetical protein